MIHIKTPFALDKNLGRVYNIAFEGLTNDDYLCLLDYDVCFLTPNTVRSIHGYVNFYTEEYKDVGMFICRTNRIHPLATDQLIDDEPSGNDSIKYWVERAKELENDTTLPHTLIDHPISGFLMVIPKRVWNKIKFDESGLCLGVDNDFSERILQAGLKIIRMDSILVWHTYRIHDIKDKSHLK